jgi:hypothetical protein
MRIDADCTGEPVTSSMPLLLATSIAVSQNNFVWSTTPIARLCITDYASVASDAVQIVGKLFPGRVLSARFSASD